MSDPDVRVRLSAEGVQEVVSAIKAVGAQSKAAAAGADSGFRTLNTTLKSTKQLMESFYVLKLIDMMAELSSRLIDFGKETLKAAGEQNDLAKQLGTTAESMSALSMVAILAKTKSETLVVGLGHLDDAIDSLRAGTPKTVEAFKRLGLSVDDFRSNDAAQHAETFARALMHVENGGTRSAIVTDILGKSGKSMITVFQKLVELNGMSGAIQLAQRSGFYVGAIATAQIEAMEMRFKLLQIYAQGAALSIFEGFGPSLIQVLDDALKATKNSRSEFEKFGEILGVVLRVARAAVLVGLAPLVESMTLIIESTKAAYALTQLIRAGAPVKDILGFTRASVAQIDRNLNEITEKAGKAVLDVFRTPKTPKATDDGQNTAAAAAAAAARQQELLSAYRAEQDSEVRLLQEKNRTEEALDAQRYERGLISLDEYYRRRNDRINAEYAADLRRLYSQRWEALAEPDPKVRAQKVATVDNEISARKTKETADGIAFVNEHEAKRLALLQQIRAAEDEARTAQGRALDSELRQIDDKEKRLRDDFFRAFGDAGMAAAEAKRLADIDREAARFKDLLATANRQLQSFETARGQIEQDVAAGLITAADGQRRLTALEVQRLPALREIATQLKSGAEALGPDDQAKVDEFTLKIERLHTAVKGFGADAKEAFRSSLIDFLGSGINQVHSLTDAFRQLGLAIAQAMQQRAASKIGNAITDFLFKMAGFAGGGLVTGPGTGTSDSILAGVSNGEYIVRAARVAQPGVLETLEGINRGERLITPDDMRTERIRRYADGGLVGGAAARLSGHITVSAEPGSSAKITTTEGDREQLKFIGRNRRAIQKLLG